VLFAATAQTLARVANAIREELHRGPATPQISAQPRALKGDVLPQFRSSSKLE
jgi:hypothetical protein